MMIRAATSDVLPIGAITAFASCIFALGVVAEELPASAGASSAPGSVSDLLNHAQSTAAADRFEQLLGAIKGAPAMSKAAEPEKPAAPVAPAVPVAPPARPAPQVAEVKADVPPPSPRAPVTAPAATSSPAVAKSGLPTLVFPQAAAGKLPGKLQGKLQDHAP